jgi:hypothetical protein
MADKKICIACGMVMRNIKYHAMGKADNDYCNFCCREDGSMQSYDEKLEFMSNFISLTKNLNMRIATREAKRVMARLPAWKDIKE